MVAVCAFGAVASIWSFKSTLDARRLGTSDDSRFRVLASETNLSRASIGELEILSRRALELLPPDIKLAEMANKRILVIRSKCLTCETRRILIDEYKNGRLTKNGLHALQNTYALSPFGDLNLMLLRLEVSERYWDELGGQNQNLALAQIEAIAAYKVGQQWLYTLDTDIVPITNKIDQIRRN